MLYRWSFVAAIIFSCLAYPLLASFVWHWSRDTTNAVGIALILGIVVVWFPLLLED
jgi:hypothetical protein